MAKLNESLRRVLPTLTVCSHPSIDSNTQHIGLISVKCCVWTQMRHTGVSPYNLFIALTHSTRVGWAGSRSTLKTFLSDEQETECPVPSSLQLQ